MKPQYAIEDLTFASTPVFFEIDGQEVAGFVRFTPAGFPRYHVGSLRQSEKLPNDVVPAAWRPVSDRWPVRLPPPIKNTSPTRPTKERTARSLPDEPYDLSVRLGRPGEPPESPEEANARMIRYVWTCEVLDRDIEIKDCAWPKDLLISARVAEKFVRADNDKRNIPWFREEDYDDFFVDRTDLRPRREPFNPTPRDVSDAQSETGPRSWSWSQPELLRLRAARPIYTWSAISEITKVPEDICRKWYQDACEVAFRRANDRRPR